MIRTKASLKGKLNTKCTIKGKVCVGVERIYPEVEDLVVTPSSEEQVFKSDNCNYGEVKVLGDEDLQASNIKQGVEIFGVTGSLEELTTETKEGINNQEEIITNQETTLEEINQVIQDKILVKEKYKPRYVYNPITFRNYTGTELDHETQMLDTTNFISMYQMFSGCKNVISLDLSEWNTSNVTNMSDMFYGCNSLTNLDINHFDTSNVTNMGGMFRSCSSLTELDLSGLDTSNVTNMGSMFEGMSNLTRLDLSNFDTSNLTNITYMFNNTNKLQYLDIRNFTFDKVTSYSYGFSYTIPSNCLIIVKSETERQWILKNGYSGFKNIKTIAELEG